ncbi:MAG TPA: cytochrome c [Alphaproteobacteria bacterium]|nr:cytochrome c [Alphaproteobacteria bacterium]
MNRSVSRRQGFNGFALRGAVFAAMGVGLLAGPAFAQDAAPAAAASSAPEDPLVAKGKYLATIGDCISCHTRPGGEEFAGGLPLKTPFGTVYTPNLTQDKDTGIGGWTEEQLVRAMREGVDDDGDHLYPVFPFTAYTKVTDEDAKAIYAYLKTIKPVSYTPPKNQMSFPYSQRWLLTFWNKMFFKPGAYQPDPKQSAEWNRGAYLVQGLGHCGACHTPRGALGNEKEEMALTGAVYNDEILDSVHEQEIVKQDNMVREWSTANLTQSKGGIATWSAEEIAQYLKTGHTDYAGATGPMATVVANSTKYLTDEDAKAMGVYLKSLPAIDRPIDKAPTADQMQKGEIAFTVRCGDCHLPTGLGSPKTPEADPTKVSPPLVGNPIILAHDPQSLINIILYGAHEKVLDDKAWPKMPGFELDFGLGMDDEQVAALATYVRNSWGNKANAVDAKDVAKQR